MIFINGEFFGADVILSMHQDGELKDKLNAARLILGTRHCISYSGINITGCQIVHFQEGLVSTHTRSGRTRSDLICHVPRQPDPCQEYFCTNMRNESIASKWGSRK